MSAKREKKNRRVKNRINQAQNRLYESKLSIWASIKPPRWRIFKYRKWLKIKPRAPKGCK